MDRINNYRTFEKMGISMSKGKLNTSKTKSMRRIEKFAAMRAACLDSTTNFDSIEDTVRGGMKPDDADLIVKNI